jgi:hypothetical protein
MSESIKVVVRFRGNEEDHHSQNTLNSWSFDPDEKSLKIPQAYVNMKLSTATA